MPRRALLNDVNPHVINFYAWLKRGLTIPFPMAGEKRAYYRRRARFNELLAQGRWRTREAAGLFYYLNRTGYNGLCRFNRSGEFNVPFGRHARITYTQDFTQYRGVFAGWEFSCTDFEAIRLESADFVYADPPYDVEFTSYAREGFTWEEQVRAAEWLAGHPGPVVLSNQETDRVVSLYKRLGFTLRPLRAPRMISRTGDRTPAREVLALKNIHL